jgi:nitrate reductase molybdenum cofactor assembly chaperone NarJ/NarW
MRRSNCKLTLRGLAHLLSYPDATLRVHLDEIVAALQDELALPKSRLNELAQLAQWMQHRSPLELEAHYVETFDRGRGSSLHLFEHVHGDSRDRGPAMIDLLQTYEKAGVYLRGGELPDHLPIVLEFASTQPPAQARSFLRELGHLLQVIFTTLQKRQSPYASVIASVLELAGEKAQAVSVPEDPTVDESWAEPAAFSGCDMAGQRRPDAPQPVHFVRAAAPNLGTHP